MSNKANPLRPWLDEVLRPAGFFRKGDSWFRNSTDVIEVVNLQKSQYGDQYYLNYSLWLQALGESSFPTEETCHIRMRVGSIISSTDSLAELLDLDSSAADDTRRADIAALLAAEFLPLADSGRTIDGLRALLTGKRLNKAMVHVHARTLLGS